jgi:hypothetical protein
MEDKMPVTLIGSRWNKTGYEGSLDFYRKDSGVSILTLSEAGIVAAGGTAAGGGLSPNIWGSCPILSLRSDPTLGVIDGDDFTRVQATGFPYALAQTNGTFLPVAGQIGGVARLLATGTDNDYALITTGNNVAGLIKADATHNWWFEARVKLSQIATEQGVFVGLSEEAGTSTDFLATNTMECKDVDYIGFHIAVSAPGAPTWVTEMNINGGGAAVVIDAAALVGSANWVKLGMKSVLGVVTFYVNGVANATTVASTAAEYPLDQVMQATFAMKIGVGTVSSLDLDWWYAAQLR